MIVCCNEQRHSRGSASPTTALKFRVEDRIECMQSHRVKYTYRDDYELALPIPLEAATNKGRLLGLYSLLMLIGLYFVLMY